VRAVGSKEYFIMVATAVDGYRRPYPTLGSMRRAHGRPGLSSDDEIELATRIAHGDQPAGNHINPVRGGRLAVNRVTSAASPGVAAAFHLSRRGGGIEGASTTEGIPEIVLGQPPRRYDVHVIRGDPFPTGHSSR
jgi:hypothetical protein